MGRTKKFIMDALVLAAAGIVLRTAAVSFNAYVSKKLGAETMGLYGLVMSVGAFAVTLASSGVNLAAVRLSAAACASGDATSAEVVRRLLAVMRKCAAYASVFGFGSAILLFALAGVIGRAALSDERAVGALRALALSLPAISLSAATAGYFTGVRQIPRSVAALVCDQAFRVLLVIFALTVADGRGAASAALALAAGNAAADWATLALSRLLARGDLRRRAKRAKEGGGSRAVRRTAHFSEARRSERKIGRDPRIGDNEKGRACPSRFGDRGVKNAAASRPTSRDRGATFGDVARIALPVAIGAYLRTGLTSLEHMAIPWGLRRAGSTPEAALASYGVVSQMALPVVLFPYAVIGAFTSLLVPEMTELSERGDMAAVSRSARRVIAVTVFFGIGVGGVFSSFGEALGTAIYKSAEAGEMIRLLAPAMPMMFLDTTVDAILKGLGEQVYLTKVNTLDAAICLATVVLAVPRFGINGYIAVIYASEAVNAALSISRLASVASLGADTLRCLLLPAIALTASGAAWHMLCGAAPALSAGVGIALYAAMYVSVGAAIWAVSRRRRIASARHSNRCETTSPRP